MFLGFVTLEDTLTLRALLRNSSRVPFNTDSLPTYRVYGSSGLMTGGTGSLSLGDSGSITGASNASPVEITSANHGLSSGTRVTISGVLGNTGANGTFVVTVTGANTFTLGGSMGTGAYTSGGTWNVTGLYKVDLNVASASGYEAGEVYQVLVSGAISSTAVGELYSFAVT